jgi:hypothetical protein
MHWGKTYFCCAFHKNYYNHSNMLDSGSFIGYNGFTIKIMEVHSYVENTRIGNAENKQGHYRMQWQA